MTTNRPWFPDYARPERFVPRVQETRVLFSRPPFHFPDFVGRAVSFLSGPEARQLGLDYDPALVLPCRWRCSDESLFQVDLSLYAYTGVNPFDKGRIGGFFNETSLAPALHHGPFNLDFGGSHVGYRPAPGGGRFGRIWRPQHGGESTNCGYLGHLLAPFQEVYEDARASILLFRPQAGEVFLSIPNEFLQPNWSSQGVKLLVDLETLADRPVAYQDDQPWTHTPVDRSLFHAHPDFAARLEPSLLAELSQRPRPIGRLLSSRYFGIFDSQAELDKNGLPRQRLLLYMRYIVAAQYGPPILKAAIVNTNLEHNRLNDAGRAKAFQDFALASFSGVFIDLWDEASSSYQVLFQPVGLTLKPRGTTRQIDLAPEEVHHHLGRVKPARPRVDLGPALGLAASERLREAFSFKPGLTEPG